MEKPMRTWIPGTVLAVSLLVSPSLQAQSIDGAASGIGAPTHTLTFSEYALSNGEAAANNWASYGVSFENLFWGTAGYSGSSFSTDAIYNFAPGACCMTSFSIIFSNAVRGASFNAVDNGSTSTVFSAYLGSTLVSSFVNTVPINNNAATNTSVFWGFDGILFDRIDISHTASGFGIDNLSYTTTPEPATLALMATGLVGLLGVGYRRRKREDEVV